MSNTVDVTRLKRDYSKDPLKRGERPAKEDLEYLYLELNMSREDVSSFLGCGKSLRNIKKFLKEYSITKDSSKSAEARKNFYLSKYGVTSPFGIKSVQEKIEKTNLDKYGSINPSSSKIVCDKRRRTFIERFGTDNPSKNDGVKKKKEDTFLSNYGVSNYTKTKEYIEKSISTNNAKYGTDYYTQTDECKERVKSTCLEKYGVSNVSQTREVKEKAKETSIRKYGESSFTKTNDFLLKVEQTCLSKYGVCYPCLTDNCREASLTTISKINLKWKEFLGASELEFPIERYSYDLKLGNILVEIDPTYTHNSTVGTVFKGNNGKPLPKDYHKKKTEVAVKAGYRCIHVFDWDDRDKIKDLVTKPTNILYARNCVVKEVNKDDVYDFLLKYHIQGNTRFFDVALGLYYNDELVSLMTFGKPRYNKKYQYELLRYCTKNSVSVTGGAEKIFKCFMQNYNPSSILSYCDLSKFTGEIYKRLGFKLERTSDPARHWYNGTKHITDNMLRSLGFDKIFGTSFGKGVSNDELMRSAGFLEVYDCGQQTWIWKRGD